MKNYEEMSDFEINKRVASVFLRLFADEKKSKGKLDSDVWLVDSNGKPMWTNYNPCLKPDHAWPIILKSRITILAPYGSEFDEVDAEWQARNNIEEPQWENMEFELNVAHKNPLRAAMICFLKMMDAK